MAEKRIPTPEQQRVIDMTDRTVLLSAAAGSGKTATLTERLITMITREENPLDVTRILVVTFTRAATEELRTRISEALSAAVLARPDDKRLARQMLLLPTARIRTIDAFCNDLVKGHTEELGISPLYRIADEAEIDLLGISLLDEVIEDAYSGAFADKEADIGRIAEIAESVKDSGTLSEMLFGLYKDKLHKMPNGVSFLSDSASLLRKEADMPFFETRAGKALSAHYKEEALHKRDLISSAADALVNRFGGENPIFSTLSPKFFYLREFCDRLATACDRTYEELRAVAESYAPPRTKNCPAGYEYSEEEALFKKLLKETADAIPAFLCDLAFGEEDMREVFLASADISRSVYLLLAEFEKRYTAEKKRRAICDYDDVAAYAYQLLLDENGAPTPLALQLRESFDTVCIDEYQDVNELQHRIFEAISTPRNRFMVGDIKQSIYAYRGAVPEIFGALRQTMPAPEENADSAVLFLTRNFRSEEPMIAFANGVFDFLFPIIRDAIGYVPEDRLRTEKEAGAVLPPTFYLLRRESKKGAKGASLDDAEELPEKTEDELIAEKVISLLQSGKKKDGSPIRPSDIAILFKEHPYGLVETLRAYGVPVRAIDKTDYFSRKEILLALCLCHAVNNPHRDIYFSGLLRSPLYGFTMDELVTVRTDHPEGSLWDALRAAVEEDPAFTKATRVISDLSRFRAMAENTPSHRLIRTMFHEVGIYAATDSAGAVNLRTFYELARSYESVSFRGLYRFLAHVAEIREYNKGLPAKDTGEEEAVTLTTIHRSKGLEFPICILAYTGKELKKPERSPFSFSKELGLVTAIPTKEGYALLKHPLLSAHSIARKRSELEEAIRVLYVALTRPKEQLYLFSSSGKTLTETLLYKVRCLCLAPSVSALYDASSYAAWILAALAEQPSLFRLSSLDPPYALEDDLDLSRKDEAETLSPAPKKDERTAEKIALFRERFSFRYPHEAETRLPAKLSVSRLYPGVLDEITARSPFEVPTDTLPSLDRETPGEAEEDDFTPTVPAFLSGKKKPGAAEAGTATHLFLQFCDFDRILTTKGCQTEIVKEELRRLCDRGFLTEGDASLVRIDELARFLGSDLKDEILAAQSVYREFRFHAMLPAEAFSAQKDGTYAGLSVFAQGVIDLLLARADGSLLLVDYKTDRLLGAAQDDEAARTLLFDRHGTQLSVYATAVERIFGKAPRVAIYSLPKGKLFFAPDTEQ